VAIRLYQEEDMFQSGADLWGPGTWEALDKQYLLRCFNPVRICGVRGPDDFEHESGGNAGFNPVRICGVRGHLDATYWAYEMKQFQSGADLWGPGTTPYKTPAFAVEQFQSGADLWGPGTGFYSVTSIALACFNPVRICGVRGRFIPDPYAEIEDVSIRCGFVGSGDW